MDTARPSDFGWPETAGAPALFLLDAATNHEAAILRSWIDEHRPESDAATDIHTLRLPSSRKAGRSDSLPAELETALAGSGDLLLVPLRVAWLAPEREGRREARLSDLFGFGDPRDPGRLRARWVSRFAPDRCCIVVADAATGSELRERWRTSLGNNVAETVGLDRFVARQAALALDRAERRLRGGRYKIPRFLNDEILARPDFRSGLGRIARDESRPIERVEKDAERYLEEIAARHSPLWIDVFARMSRSSSTRGYENLRFDRAEVARIRELSERYPLVFLPTHKSNLDHPVLFRALGEEGLPPSHTAGGDNMNFFPTGPIARRAGIFFIRRTFGENELYKYVMRSYIDFLVEKRFPLQWFIEGGRSRSGKLLPPRFGLLSYAVDSYARGKSEDLILIPVAVAYDQISEVADYAAEQGGGQKQGEGIGWLFRFLRGLSRRYGNIDLRFGEPLSLRAALGPPSAAIAEDKLVVPKLAFEVCDRINRVTPATPISLAMLAMLGSGDRAMSLGEIHRALRDIAAYVTSRGLPTTEKLHFESEDGVRETLGILVDSGVLLRFDDGPEAIYSIAPNQYLAAAYYRNTVVHFLTPAAIAELALLRAADASVGKGLEEFWAEAMRLRDLLKFEFFFSDKEQFQEQLRHELSLRDRDWESRIEDPDVARELLHSIRPFLAHRTLRSFLDGYAVVADRLAMLRDAEVEDDKQLVQESLGWGRQYLLQRRIRSGESVSKDILGNAVKLAGNRGLLRSESADLAEDRIRFADELRDTLRRIDAIEALALARRAGTLD